jgi:hypothetical protein
MDEELGLLCLNSTLVTTNGRPKSRSKRQSYTSSKLGRVKAASHSNPSSPRTGTPTYRWRPVLSKYSINSLTNIQELAFYLMPSKTTMQDCRLPLLVWGPMTALLLRGMISKLLLLICFPYDIVAMKRARNPKMWLGPAATNSLERRGTLTNASAREPVPQPDANHSHQNWDPGGGRIFIRDNHLRRAIVALMNGVGDGPGEESRTDLDSHATMPVVGSGAQFLADHNRTCEVSPYSPDYEPMEAPLVNAAVRYDRDGRVYILLIRNAIYVPSLDHNLLPPFMMREAGVIVKDTPKIQMDDPSEEDHAITFPETVADG